MRQFINVLEDYAAQPNRWVHYSQINFLSVNPKPFHQDPAGLYFFPEKFDPVGMWTKYRYKFTATLKPSANVLDLAHVTDEELNAMIDGAGIRDKFEAYLVQYPPKDMNEKMKRAWEYLVRYYAWENGEGKQLAKFNKMLRSLNYDAIFDDGKIVHSAEEQLIVLNPRCIDIIDMERRSGSGFEAMKKVLDDVVALCKEYGEVEITPPKKEKERYSDKTALKAQVKVSRAENNYLYVSLYAGNSGGAEQGVPPDVIHVSSLYSSPNLGAGYGESYNILKHRYENRFGDEKELGDIRRALEKTFSRKDA